MTDSVTKHVIVVLTAPEMSIMQCGMRFASDGSMSTAERFIGNLDSVRSSIILIIYRAIYFKRAMKCYEMLTKSWE